MTAIIGAYGAIFSLGTMASNDLLPQLGLDLLWWPIDGQQHCADTSMRFPSALTGGATRHESFQGAGIDNYSHVRRQQFESARGSRDGPRQFIRGPFHFGSVVPAMARNVSALDCSDG